ncbi:PucR C-terminal helix-turn-helix domain-containing protein [Ignavigranum ruoffiae]|uniref:PucR C-terminal helix-turn-helix domain-containing protein n=1 Tax=Ignavigranum ruoffiae TaxID=89093 RepID=A0A1H9B3S9_9LACT|nr:helix-turn-helix domain-containing protein [Ignavigranum ruoffiae]SEP83676.1 PucR C-terminal helix-turn-helix domain-containing protein [Ignavigranum ruoffiae]
MESNNKSFNYSKIAVEDFIKTNICKTSKIISSSKGINNFIYSTNIVDIENIEDWLHEGEALIIGVFFEKLMNKEFIIKLKNKNTACIISKKKFEIFLLPKYKDMLINFDIPIIFVDDKYSWSDVIVSIQEVIIYKQTQKLIETDKFYDQIISWFNNNLTISKICHEFYNATGYSMIILDNFFNIIDYSYDTNWNKFISISINELSKIELLGYKLNNEPLSGYILSINNKQLYIIPTSIIEESKFYIGIKTNTSSKIIPSDILSKIDILKELILLQMKLHTEINISNLHFRNNIFSSILALNEHSEAEKINLSLALNTNIHDKYFLVMVEPIDDKNTIIQNVHQLYSFLNNNNWFFDKNLFFSYQNNWVILIPNFIFKKTDLQEDILNPLEKYFNTSFYLAISNCHFYFETQKSYDEAISVISFLKQTIGEDKIMSYSELGNLELFINETKHVNEYFIMKMINAYILPLTSYDKKHSSNLFETLQSFYTCNLSYKLCSNILFIHTNTLRSRISTIEKLLNLNIKDTSTITNFKIACMLYKKFMANEP